MKKLLALVLALVMTLGLATVSSSAAYSDEADVSLNEAVDVMSAVGVFQGADGKFSPKANLNREQAAKLIAYLDLGETAAEALPAVKVFSDVPATSWSAKYIAYCADAGYIAGDGTGKFNPAGELNGYAFGKMLLCVLGYDADIEGFTGNNWSINVAKLMEKNDINDGVSGAASATLTREQAAQYCLNALEATTVEYDTKGTSIEINGAKIATGASKAESVTAKGAKYAAISGEDAPNDDTTYTVELGEKLYKGDLKLANGDGDDFGRENKEWTYKNTKVIASRSESADITFVASKTYTKVAAADGAAAKVAALFEEVNDQLNLKYSSKLKKAEAGTAMYTNGGDNVIADLQIGDTVEIYLNDDDNKVVDKFIVVRYAVGQIADVSTKLTNAQKDDGATCKIKIDEGFSYLSSDIEGFDAAKFIEDAYILYVDQNDGGTHKMIATAIPTTVEGKVTATKGSKAQIGGTYYENTVASVANGDEGTFYLGTANQIVAVDTTAAKSTDYAYVYNWTFESKANSDGVKDSIFTIYYVTVDGVKGSAVAKTEKGDANKYYIDDGGAGKTGILLGTVVTDGDTTTYTPNEEAQALAVAFSINSDGKFVQKTAKDTIIRSADASVNKTDPAVGTGVVATDDTKFIFVYVDGSSYKTKSATGYKNVTVASSVMNSVVNTDGEAIYTFVAENNSYKSDTKLAVILDSEPTATTVSDKDYLTFDVAIDGEATTLTFKKDDADALKKTIGTGSSAVQAVVKGTVFAYKMDGKYAKVDDDLDVVGMFADGLSVGPVEVKVKGTGYFGTETVPYVSTKDAELYTVTMERDEAKDEITVTVSEGAKFVTGDDASRVIYTIDSGTDADVVFVYDFIGDWGA